VSFSLSPLLHNRAFAACRLDAVYVPLQAEALEPFLAARPALGLSGFSVTAPYKVEILRHLDQVEEGAALGGSINTVLVEEGGALRGLSTDGVGVTAPLERHLALEGATVGILGAGGAARAAACALRRKGAAVILFARDPERAAEVARVIGCGYAPLAAAGEHALDVVVNATPVGSLALPAQSLFPAHFYRPGAVAFDMVYEPADTRFLREARAAGAATIGGLEMLLGQAVGQFEAWTGQSAPVNVMREALFAGREKQS
jgi:shikimate dehydrogenase